MKYIPCRKILLTLIITFSLLLVNAAAADTMQKKILAFGDSLTAGYGIPREKAFPAQLEQRLTKEGINVKVVNGGVTGDTTSGGLTRLAWVLEMLHPDFVILEFGGNDMLRGINPQITRHNLQKMLEIMQEKKIPVLLAGMKATPNLGTQFTDDYQKMYTELAKKYNSGYYPFFLEKVAMQPSLMQDDGLHPNAAGVAVIVDNIMPSVKELLRK